jgi:copper chaperone CopZ
MNELVVVAPDLWADHHVLAARRALHGLPGVREVVASARDTTVWVVYDPGETDDEAILSALNAAGYPAGEPVAAEEHTDKPAWAGAPRVTRTNATDIAMSGDYRQY